MCSWAPEPVLNHRHFSPHGKWVEDLGSDTTLGFGLREISKHEIDENEVNAKTLACVGELENWARTEQDTEGQLVELQALDDNSAASCCLHLKSRTLAPAIS